MTYQFTITVEDANQTQANDIFDEVTGVIGDYMHTHRPRYDVTVGPLTEVLLQNSEEPKKMGYSEFKRHYIESRDAAKMSDWTMGSLRRAWVAYRDGDGTTFPGAA